VFAARTRAGDFRHDQTYDSGPGGAQTVVEVGGTVREPPVNGPDDRAHGVWDENDIAVERANGDRLCVWFHQLEAERMKPVPLHAGIREFARVWITDSADDDASGSILLSHIE